MRSSARSPRVATLTLAIALLAGCGEERSAIQAVYRVPASLDELSQRAFFDHPWPSDLRLENGSPRFAGYYNPKGSPPLEAYVEAVKGKLDGFSPAAAGYLRFSGAVDPKSLPATPEGALLPTASVQLLDIDPSSPEHGERKLVSLRWRKDEATYYAAHTLAFMPTLGFPLRPKTRYALVVTDGVTDEAGLPLSQNADLAKVIGVSSADATTKAAASATASAVAEIEAAGIAPDRIVHLAVFTTNDPTLELIQVRDAVASAVAAPKPIASQWNYLGKTKTNRLFTGRYGPSPNFQHGNLPFSQPSDGGDFLIENGVPVLADTFDLRFAITVPDATRCPMPPDGYPIVLYAHGTGGDYGSFVADGTADSLAEVCLATMGIDQIFHGDRPGAPADGNGTTTSILFFNFMNPVAARTNGRQAAIDEVQRARLFTETKMTIPASVAKTGGEIRFDGSKLMYFGHSQGGLNGPLFTAVDSSARGAVFSGSGASMSITVLEKTQPTPSPAALVRTLMLQLGDDPLGELDVFHPAISLLQSIVDVEDPLHYGRLQAREPRPGFAPKSIYMTEGVSPDGAGDSYAPPHGIEVHAVAMGLPVQEPVVHPIPEAAFSHPASLSVPPSGLSGNLGRGRASGILAQWVPPDGSDGHFVIFDVPQARQQAAKFLQNLAGYSIGQVPAP